VRNLILSIVAALLLIVLVGSACRTAPAYVATGYETDQGYMQPDHSAAYYWLMYHSTFGFYRPYVSYHVYTPPMGYPSTYRPWYGRTVTPSYRYDSRTPARTSGGFSGTAPRSYATPSPPARSSGGFSTPRSYSAPAPRSYATPSTPARSSGGFSAPRSYSSPSPARSSGGFSSGRRR
jgi:hypothetical protein